MPPSTPPARSCKPLSLIGIGIDFGGTLLQDLPVAGQVLNMMDAPRHTHIRRPVSCGLTPRMIRRVEDDL